MVLSDRAQRRWGRATIGTLCALCIGLNLMLAFRSSATSSDQFLGLLGAGAGLFTLVALEAMHHDRWFTGSRWGRTRSGWVARYILIGRRPFDVTWVTIPAMFGIPFWLLIG